MYTYEQSTGKLYTSAGSLFGTGYSGNGEGKNNPAWQAIKDHGPLPCGVYQAIRLIERDPQVGWYAIHLAPNSATETAITLLGRDWDSFYMHGDSVDHPGSASDGCLVFNRSTRLDFWQGSDKMIQVVPGPAISPNVNSSDMNSVAERLDAANVPISFPRSL